MRLFIRLRFIMGGFMLSLLLLAFFFYGRDDYALFFLLIPILSMLRRQWSDTHHTLFAIIYGFGFLISLGFYLLMSFFNGFSAEEVSYLPLMLHEISALVAVVLSVSMLTHLAFALCERHDEPYGYVRR